MDKDKVELTPINDALSRIIEEGKGVGNSRQVAVKIFNALPPTDVRCVAPNQIESMQAAINSLGTSHPDDYMKIYELATNFHRLAVKDCLRCTRNGKGCSTPLF
jgi:hypothetical protein